MIPSSLLAIAIPTYNRSDILRENLKRILPELREHRVAVYISDDSTDDLTRELCVDLYAEFPLLVYKQNNPRLGHDANFIETLSIPQDVDYVWYMGDSLYFVPGALSYILNVLAETRPDFCFLNAYVPEIGARLIEGSEVHGFLLDRTWYLTLSGATIYGRSPRNIAIPKSRWADWRNFPQLGLILEACSDEPQRLYWLGEPLLKFNRKKSSYWLKSAMSVFIEDWSRLIRSFPLLFSPEEQNIVIRSHGMHTGLFGPISLIQLRALGALTVDEIDKYSTEFVVASPISPRWAHIVSRLPQRPLAIILSLAVYARNLVRSKK